MLDKLRALFRKNDLDEPTQTQREATLDLLVWMMYADHRIALPESEEIDRMAEELDWESVTPLPQYYRAAVARVRDVLGDEDARTRLLTHIDERLATDAMRQRAYRAGHELAEADGEVAGSEIAFLDRLRRRFDLERDG